MELQPLWFSKADISRLLSYDKLIEALHYGFQRSWEAPLRHHHNWGPRNDEALIMPAWDIESFIVKSVTLCPDNSKHGVVAINGIMVLFDGENGQLQAMFDAGELTARRTAAASALASRFLSRVSATSLLIVGTGRLVTYLCEAHLSVRNIEHVKIWGRSNESAKEVVAKLQVILPDHIDCEEAVDLEAAVIGSDIISLATRSTEPLIRGSWLSQGTHLDLVGGYRPDMREVDNDTVKLSRVFADTIAGVLTEAGDILQPIACGTIDKTHIKAELSDLCGGRHLGRKNETEVTLFKSVGTALEDLVAGRLAYQLTENS